MFGILPIQRTEELPPPSEHRRRGSRLDTKIAEWGGEGGKEGERDKPRKGRREEEGARQGRSARVSWEMLPWPRPHLYAIVMSLAEPPGSFLPPESTEPRRTQPQGHGECCNIGSSQAPHFLSDGCGAQLPSGLRNTSCSPDSSLTATGKPRQFSGSSGPRREPAPRL